MKEQANLFYEDTKKRKQLFLILTTLFYIGAIMGLSAIILYRLISPVSLMYYQPSGEDVCITVFCLIFAISSTVFVIKAKRFKYFTVITESEIELMGNELFKFKISDLKSYEVDGKKRMHTRFKLIFSEHAVFIYTRKPEELKAVLNKIKHTINNNSI